MRISNTFSYTLSQKEHCHEVSSEHINQLNLKLRKSDVSELNAEELEAISGGSGPTACMKGCSW